MLLCISINLPYGHEWNTVVMSGNKTSILKANLLPLSCKCLEKQLLALIVFVLSLSKLETVLAQTVGGRLNGEPRTT